MEQNIQTGKRIQQRREELGLNLGDIAKEVGVAVSTIQRYEKGKIEKIKLPVIEAIAKALQVDPAWLLCQTDRMTVSSVEVSSISNLIPLPQTYRIPLVGEIACGSPILAEENVEEILEIPQHIKADFALRCHGDSMIESISTTATSCISVSSRMWTMVRLPLSASKIPLPSSASTNTRTSWFFLLPTHSMSLWSTPETSCHRCASWARRSDSSA